MDHDTTISHFIPSVLSETRIEGNKAVHLVLGSSSGFRRDASPEEDSVLPARGLDHQRDALGPPAAKEDGIDGDSLRILPLGVDDRALSARRTEAGVGVGAGRLAAWFPLPVEPVNHLQLLNVHLVLQTLPKDSTVAGAADIREYGVLLQDLHGIRICLV